jgi:hypothetical protein
MDKTRGAKEHKKPAAISKFKAPEGKKKFQNKKSKF